MKITETQSKPLKVEIEKLKEIEAKLKDSENIELLKDVKNQKREFYKLKNMLFSKKNEKKPSTPIIYLVEDALLTCLIYFVTSQRNLLFLVSKTQVALLMILLKSCVTSQVTSTRIYMLRDPSTKKQ